MSDLIERQSVIDALHGYFDGMLETDTWSPCDVYGLIEILPSAQPEIIRCKDCKHWNELLAICNKSKRLLFGVNDFCSKAERGEV